MRALLPRAWKYNASLYCESLSAAIHSVVQEALGLLSKPESRCWQEPCLQPRSNEASHLPSPFLPGDLELASMTHTVSRAREPLRHFFKGSPCQLPSLGLLQSPALSVKLLSCSGVCPCWSSCLCKGRGCKFLTALFLCTWGIKQTRYI